MEDWIGPIQWIDWIGSTGAAAPQVNLSSTSVSEDAAIGTVVGTFSVSNLPEGVTVSSWAITADPDTKFDNDGADLITEAALDYETATSHSVTGEATLSDASTVSGTFTITVIDVISEDALLLEDGTNRLLLEDGSGVLLLETA